MNLTLQHFFLGEDVVLVRTWEFHHFMIARQDTAYHPAHRKLLSRLPKDPDERSQVGAKRSLPKPSKRRITIRLLHQKKEN
jgi:hypothetical protein